LRLPMSKPSSFWPRLSRPLKTMDAAQRRLPTEASTTCQNLKQGKGFRGNERFRSGGDPPNAVYLRFSRLFHKISCLKPTERNPSPCCVPKGNSQRPSLSRLGCFKLVGLNPYSVKDADSVTIWDANSDFDVMRTAWQGYKITAPSPPDRPA